MQVIIHPIALLSTLDEHKKRKVGILLGHKIDNTFHVTDSFFVPFHESEQSFVLDVDYVQSMFALHKRISSKESIIGWFRVGEPHYNDDSIHNEVLQLTSNPVFALIHVSYGFPVSCYVNRVPVHTVLAGEEAEEVGMEQLVRSVTLEGTETQLQRLNDFYESLSVLKEKKTCAGERLSTKGEEAGLLYSIEEQLLSTLIAQTARVATVLALASKNREL